jgi:hypothetical protein
MTLNRNIVVFSDVKREGQVVYYFLAKKYKDISFFALLGQ